MQQVQQQTPDSSKTDGGNSSDDAHGVECVSCGIRFFKVSVFLTHSCVTRSNRERMA
jgi:hypothetical protein